MTMKQKQKNRPKSLNPKKSRINSEGIIDMTEDTPSLDAVICYIDMENSSSFCDKLKHPEWMGVITEFKKMAFESFDHLSRIRSIDPDKYFVRAEGDSILLLLWTGEKIDLISNAIAFAVLLRSRWDKSKFNLQRHDEYKEPLEIRTGINTGLVTLLQNPFDEREKNPEGFAISLAQRIESAATQYSSATKILLRSNVAEIILDSSIEIRLGEQKQYKPDGFEIINVIPVEDYSVILDALNLEIKEKIDYPNLMAEGHSFFMGSKYKEALSCYLVERFLNNIAYL